MPIITKGPLSVSTFGVKTPIPLLDWSAALEKISGGIDENGGLGSIMDDPDIIGTVGVRNFNVGKSSLITASASCPTRIKVRVYYWELDRLAVKYLGSDSDQTNSLVLSACDVILSEAGDGSLLGVATTRENKGLRGSVVPALESAGKYFDFPLQTSFDDKPLSIPDADFFFWLMYRYHYRPELSDSFTLADLRDIAGLDFSLRSAALSHGISLDRVELLAMIMGGMTQFGPATIEFVDDDLSLDGSVKLFPDGGFSPVIGRSKYTLHDEFYDRAQLGERLLDDLTFKIIPALIEEYNFDDEWRQVGRTEYIQKAREAMTSALAALS